MRNIQMKKIYDLLTPSVRTVAVMGHERPDGDCAGSVLALWHYLKENYSELSVTAYLQPLTENIEFLKGSEEFDIPAITFREDDGAGENYDLAISVDSADLNRIGAGKEAFKAAKHTACIDHHATNTGFAEVNYVIPEAAAACEVLCDLLDMDKVSRDTAICLYTGIAHDSGVFRYEATTGETLRKTAVLMERGVPFSEIIRKSIAENSYRERKVAAQILTESTLIPEERFMYAKASKAFQERNMVTDMQLGGVVSYLNGVQEAEVVLFIYQRADGTWKGSLRTKSVVDATAIASHFNGGGHVRAAGFSYDGDPTDAILQVREITKALLSEKTE